MSADEILARGLSTLNRFLDSDDPKVALKAVELLLRLHTRQQKEDAEDETTPAFTPAVVNAAEGGPHTPCAGAKKPHTACADHTPSSPRLNVPTANGHRPLTSFLPPPPANKPSDVMADALAILKEEQRRMRGPNGPNGQAGTATGRAKPGDGSGSSATSS